MSQSLAPKADFLLPEGCAHLAAGGQTPFLASHLRALDRFARAKGAGLAGRDANLEVRHRVASRLAARLQCDADELGFPSSVAHGMALLAESLDWQPGDNVVMEAWEFPSVLYPWIAQRDKGVEIRAVAPTDWRVSPQQLGARVDDRTRIIALSHVSYLTGERHDVDAYREIADAVDAMLVVDASHSLGAVPVRAPTADFLFSCCYKWILGAQGVAVAYWNRERRPDWRPRMMGWHSVSPAAPLERAAGASLLDTGRVFEPGNPNYPGLYVLDNALEYLDRFPPRELQDHVLDLSRRVRAGLVDHGLEIMTPCAPEARAGNIAFATTEAPRIRSELEGRGVLVTGEDDRVRISTHLYNDTEDVSRGLAALREVL